jgi:Type II secretion system (T2SS), protein E, N-terminal domain
MLSLQTKFGPAWQQWWEHLSCNNAACTASGRIWKRVSNGAGNLRVHGARYCFPGCFEGEMRRRFTRLLSAPLAKPRRAHRIPLGLLMLSRGDIDSTQLRAALTSQRDSGRGRIGEWMQQMGFTEESQVTAALGAQWACPVLPGIPASLSDCELPLPLLRRFRMAAVSYIAATRVMHVAFADGIEYSVLLAIEQALECRAEACLARESALASLLARLEEEPRRSDQVFPQARTPDEMTRITSSYAAMLAAKDVRLTRCAEFLWVRVAAGRDSANLLFPAEEMTRGTRNDRISFVPFVV